MRIFPRHSVACFVTRAAWWWTTMMARLMPAWERWSSMWCRRERPATGRSGFGIAGVRGAMRLPSPAARTMASIDGDWRIGPGFSGCEAKGIGDTLRTGREHADWLEYG